MTDAGTVTFVVYVATVALSAPAALAVAVLARARSIPAALGTVVGVLAGVVTLAATVALALVSIEAGVVVFLAGQGALVGCCLLPVALGGLIVGRATGADSEATLRAAVTAWPLALAVSFAVFLAPAGGDLTTLSGLAAPLGWSVWIETVLFGPGLLGAAGLWLWRRVR